MPSESQDVIDRQAAAVTAAAVFLILICTIGGNLLQQLNNAYWFSSDSIFAICLGLLTSIPLCGGGGLDLDSSFETVFFLYLLPPILFESGYALNHKDFFRNFGAIILFAVVGTIISAVVMVRMLHRTETFLFVPSCQQFQQPDVSHTPYTPFTHR